MTKEYILDFLRTNKELLHEKYNVTKIGLFGSYAKGLETSDSDIDIAIVSHKKDFFIREDLREFLEASFHLKVDLGYVDSFREYYKKRIEGDIIYV
ncbi:nucleotidyltransferase domain-containing protein [Sulfurimonas sp. SAG-AH-194-C21]|nr:nucleotidyltransferase domain-containing protein [Sulfurimonas sp. SAG-AH-194-C21]MDF1882383.1 nucleotidyltransferase domain-containing protein [Sulfurimonas sp. SAG-AH-194-C21]